MALTLDGYSIVYMTASSQESKNLGPECLPRGVAGVAERLSVANHDEAIACTREENVDTFRGEHEADVTIRVAARERNNHYVAFFALVIIFEH